MLASKIENLKGQNSNICQMMQMNATKVGSVEIFIGNENESGKRIEHLCAIIDQRLSTIQIFNQFRDRNICDLRNQSQNLQVEKMKLLRDHAIQSSLVGVQNDRCNMICEDIRGHLIRTEDATESLVSLETRIRKRACSMEEEKSIFGNLQADFKAVSESIRQTEQDLRVVENQLNNLRTNTSIALDSIHEKIEVQNRQIQTVPPITKANSTSAQKCKGLKKCIAEISSLQLVSRATYEQSLVSLSTAKAIFQSKLCFLNFAKQQYGRKLAAKQDAEIQLSCELQLFERHEEQCESDLKRISRDNCFLKRSIDILGEKMEKQLEDISQMCKQLKTQREEKDRKQKNLNESQCLSMQLKTQTESMQNILNNLLSESRETYEQLETTLQQNESAQMECETERSKALQPNACEYETQYESLTIKFESTLQNLQKLQLDLGPDATLWEDTVKTQIIEEHKKRMDKLESQERCLEGELEGLKERYASLKGSTLNRHNDLVQKKKAEIKQLSQTRNRPRKSSKLQLKNKEPRNYAAPKGRQRFSKRKKKQIASKDTFLQDDCFQFGE